LAFWISLAETCNNNLLANFSQKQDRKSAWEPDGKGLKSRDYHGPWLSFGRGGGVAV